MLILGIESSCDETAAAVVRDGREIFSSVISSQIELHRPFGGVVPDLASREHLEKIDPVDKQAIAEAGISCSGFGCGCRHARSRTDRLVAGRRKFCEGSRVGSWTFRLSASITSKVTSIRSHLKIRHVEYPALALIVSGGHTNLFFVPEEGKYKVVSRTRDDAAGEAFDKVGKMLGLEYPGGPVIEKLAREGDAK